MPTAGASPSRRNSSAVSGNLPKRSAFWAVCSWKFSSTTKPRAAIRSAGRSNRCRSIVPNSSAAVSHVARVPGTPTDFPELTTVAKSRGSPPSSRNSSSVNVAGAVSRPSIVRTSPVSAL